MKEPQGLNGMRFCSEERLFVAQNTQSCDIASN